MAARGACAGGSASTPRRLLAIRHRLTCIQLTKPMRNIMILLVLFKNSVIEDIKGKV